MSDALEAVRLEQARTGKALWKKWEPYLREALGNWIATRQWIGTRWLFGG
jgi:hypothetical protein